MLIPPNPHPEQVEVTQEDRDTLEAIDEALGSLMHVEREIVLEALARRRLASLAKLRPEKLEKIACRFDGVEYTHADLEVAQRAACVVVPSYGTGDHGEQEAAREGKLWNDHPAVQGALRALHESRLATASEVTSEDQAYDPAQIAFDQQCDDPAPGDWNDACLHISKELRELRASLANRPADDGGWIVGNNVGQWRTFDSFGWAWTDRRDLAVRYARRQDAEMVHCEDENAWRVEPFAPPQPEGVKRP